MYGKIHDLKCSSLANYFKKGTLEFNYTRFKQTIPLTSNNTLFQSVILPLQWLQWNLRERDTFGNRRPYNPNTSLFPIYKNYSLSRLVITVSTIGIYSGVATTGPIRAANFWRTLFKLSLCLPTNCACTIGWSCTMNLQIIEEQQDELSYTIRQGAAKSATMIELV